MGSTNRGEILALQCYSRKCGPREHQFGAPRGDCPGYSAEVPDESR